MDSGIEEAAEWRQHLRRRRNGAVFGRLTRASATTDEEGGRLFDIVPYDHTVEELD